MLAGVALGAAAAGFVASPWLLQRDAGDAATIAGARFGDLAGNWRSLAEWRGKVLVVNFWATWCAPCREEIPMLMDARNKHAQSGVEVVGIAIDMDAKVIEYAAQMKIGYPILVAGSEGLDLMRKLGNSAGGLPYTVLIDRQGNPGKRKLGALGHDELDAMLTSVIARDTGSPG